MDYFLIIIGFFLIIINIRPLKKEKNSFNKVLDKERSNISDLDMMREELLRDITVTLDEMQEDISGLKGKHKSEIGKVTTHALKSGSTQMVPNIDGIKDSIVEKTDIEDLNIGNSDIENSDKQKGKAQKSMAHKPIIQKIILEEPIPEKVISEKPIIEELIKDEVIVVAGAAKAAGAAGKIKNGNSKVNTISKLLDLGLSTEEISEKTHISKGEILLIKELYLK